MEEIYRNGPVQATMKVYQDFFSYHHGVYKHSPDAEIRRTGYHSVRIVGWGVDHGIFPPQKYWVSSIADRDLIPTKISNAPWHVEPHSTDSIALKIFSRQPLFVWLTNRTRTEQTNRTELRIIAAF